MKKKKQLNKGPKSDGISKSESEFVRKFLMFLNIFPTAADGILDEDDSGLKILKSTKYRNCSILCKILIIFMRNKVRVSIME